ncbi:MAG: gamma-glutamyltransferase [Pseudomonadota bacterium]
MAPPTSRDRMPFPSVPRGGAPAPAPVLAPVISPAPSTLPSPLRSSVPLGARARMLARALPAALALALPCAAAGTAHEASGNGGAVASISAPASQAALTILERGGNAVDAAVAAAATLGVTDPLRCGIGGGGFMVIYLARERRVVTIDHRATAPAGFGAAGARAQDGDGALAVGVPGSVRGWHEALERYGTMSLRQVLAPAIAAASAGVAVSEPLHQLMVENEGKLRQSGAAAALYLKDGKALPTGAIMRNPGLVKAYREIAAGGARAFYEGQMARAMVEAVARPAAAGAARARAGVLSMADLANYEARIRQPARSSYRGYDLYGMALPSSGGVAIGETLNILEGYELGKLERAQALHLYLEASRLAFADRDAYLADPEYVDAPIAGLLSKPYAAQQRARIAMGRAAEAVAAGDPYPFQSDPSVPLRPAGARAPTESAHTTHLALADKDGNIVAYTFTLEAGAGSGIAVPGYGFLLNNELAGFEQAGPNPNAPEGGKRPRSSMAPTIVFKDGKPAFTLGSPGGAAIVTTLVQTMVNHIDFGMSMEEALEAPRISARAQGPAAVESAFAAGAQAQALREQGHAIGAAQEELGAVCAIVFNPDGTVTALAESRRGGGGSALAQQLK